MSNYANKADKEIIVTLAACVGFADVLLQCDFRNKKKAKRNLQAMLNQAVKTMDSVVDGLDDEQVKAIVRFAKNSELMVLPKSDVRLRKELYIVPQEEFDRLILAPGNECCFCTKEGKEIKRCQRRKDLANCGLAASSSGECPYQM